MTQPDLIYPVWGLPGLNTDLVIPGVLQLDHNGNMNIAGPGVGAHGMERIPVP